MHIYRSTCIYVTHVGGCSIPTISTNVTVLSSGHLSVGVWLAKDHKLLRRFVVRRFIELFIMSGRPGSA